MTQNIQCNKLVQEHPKQKWMHRRVLPLHLKRTPLEVIDIRGTVCNYSREKQKVHYALTKIIALWNDITPTLTWEIIDRAHPYVNDSKACSLCLTEKFHIITSKKNLLNKRSDLVSTCSHVNKFLLKNHKVVPPDVSLLLSLAF